MRARYFGANLECALDASRSALTDSNKDIHTYLPARPRSSNKDRSTDVLVTMKDELGRLRTETILQGISVLAVNSRAQGETAEAARARAYYRNSQ